MSTVRITPLGGASEIGANSYLLEMGGLRILLDCGLHPKKEGTDALPEFKYLDKPPDAVLISHAHVDHCGALPYLLKRNTGTAAFTTIPTASIMDRMLHNSVSVMEILRDERLIPEYPLYEHSDVDSTMRKICGVEMDTEFTLRPDSPVRVRFSSAGHVLGSATIEVSTPDHCVYYTGDICTGDQELMQGYTAPSDGRTVDTLIIESTQGANDQADAIRYTDEIDEFAQEITKVLVNGGAVLVPSFAVGRAQEILNIIRRLQDTGRIPDVPVYASGLGRAIYDVYNRYSDYLKPGTVLTPLSQFERIDNARNPAAIKKLLAEPCIIVATSGMMVENTPSALIAQHVVCHEHHAIFFVGYCDPDTLGYKIRHASVGDSFTFVTGGEAMKLRLKNIRGFHFSAHAPRKDLQAIVEKLRPKNLVVVHGDPEAASWIRDNCGDGCAKFLPQVGKAIEIQA